MEEKERGVEVEILMKVDDVIDINVFGLTAL